MRTEIELLDAYEYVSVMSDQVDFELSEIAKEGADVPRTIEDLKLAKRIAARVIDVLAWMLGHDGEFEKRVAHFRASVAAAEDEDRVQNHPDSPRVEKITEVKGSHVKPHYRGPRSRRERRIRKPYR